MGSIRKTFHDDIYVIGDIIGQALNVTSAIVSTTLYVGGAVTLNNTLTVAGAAVFNGNVDINSQFEVHDSTSEITFQHGIFRVSLVGGTTLFRLTDTDGMDINNTVKLAIGETLYVDNIMKSDAGLGNLNIEGIGIEGNFLYTDNIAEKTLANGIRIDQLRIKDNTLNHITPGTEIIVEEDLRIRDPHKLQVSIIEEADLSSDITLQSTTIVTSNFTAGLNVYFTNITAPANHQALVVDTSGQVSTLAALTVLTSPSPDRVFINGDLQINAGPGTGGKIDLTNGFGTIYNETLITSDTATHVLLSSVYSGAIFLLVYSQTGTGAATENKGALIVGVMLDSSSGTVRVRATELGISGSSQTISYADDNATECDITVKSTSAIEMRWSLLRIG